MLSYLYIGENRWVLVFINKLLGNRKEISHVSLSCYATVPAKTMIYNISQENQRFYIFGISL